MTRRRPTPEIPALDEQTQLYSTRVTGFGSPLAAPAIAAAPELGRAVESPGDAYQREREAERDALAARVTELSEQLYRSEQQREREQRDARSRWMSVSDAYEAVASRLPLAVPALAGRLATLGRAIERLQPAQPAALVDYDETVVLEPLTPAGVAAALRKARSEELPGQSPFATLGDWCAEWVELVRGSGSLERVDELERWIAAATRR